MRDKASNIAKNPKYNGYQHGLASMVYKFFDKNPASLSDKLLPLEQLKMKLCLIKNWLKNWGNQLFENFKQEKYAQLL